MIKKYLVMLLVGLMVLSVNSCLSNASKQGEEKKQVIKIKKQIVKQFDSKNEKPHLYIEEYNEDGYMTFQSYYTPDGELLLVATYELDENNNVIKRISELPTSHTTYYKNEENGKWYYKTIYSSSVLEDTERELDKAPQAVPFEDFVKRTMDADRENSELVQYVEYKVEYTEYDEYGNWLKCSLIRENEVVLIERKLELWGNPKPLKKQIAINDIARQNTANTRDSLIRVKNSKDSLDKVLLEKKLVRLGEYFTEKKDDFSDITWVEHINNPKFIDCNGCYLYFALRDGEPENLRFKFQYYAEDWLFIDELIFNADGEIFHIYPERMKRDNDGGYIWEWYDTYIGNSSGVSAEFINKLANSLNIKVKMVGSQYSKVRELTSKEISAICVTYEYYRALGGTL